MKTELTMTRKEIEEKATYIQLVQEVRANIESANEKRKSIQKALDALNKSIKEMDSKTSPFDVQKSKIHEALRRIASILNEQSAKKLKVFVDRILNKLIVKLRSASARRRNNAGAFVCLLNKLKPTDDGKDDSVNVKAQLYEGFFINFGVITNERFKNQAFA